MSCDSDAMSSDLQNRRTDRQRVDMKAHCRTVSSLRDKGEICDLSPVGCRVTTGGLFIDVGMRVLIRPEGLEGLTGVVRWINGVAPGIEFDTPLYGPVFENLAAHHSAGKAVNLEKQ